MAEGTETLTKLFGLPLVLDEAKKRFAQSFLHGNLKREWAHSASPGSGIKKSLGPRPIKDFAATGNEPGQSTSRDEAFGKVGVISKPGANPEGIRQRSLTVLYTGI
jgi:hypothetical protein